MSTDACKPESFLSIKPTKKKETMKSAPTAKFLCMLFTLVVLCVLASSSKPLLQRDTRPCRNGGTFSEDGLCVCQDEFKSWGTYEQNYHNQSCALRNCLHSDSSDPDPSDRNRCQCSRGWSGVLCNICQNDASCGSDYRCDKSFLIHRLKRFDCETTSEDANLLMGKHATFQCKADAPVPILPGSGPKNKTYTCYMQSWGNKTVATDEEYEHGITVPEVYEQVLDCEMRNCRMFIDKVTGSVKRAEVKCTDTRCACSMRSQMCNPFVVTATGNIHGESRIVCEASTGDCEMIQTEFEAILPLRCSPSGIGECIRSNETIDEDYDSMTDSGPKGTDTMLTLEPFHRALIVLVGSVSAALVSSGVIFLLIDLALKRRQVEQEVSGLTDMKVVLTVNKLRYFVRSGSSMIVTLRFLCCLCCRCCCCNGRQTTAPSINNDDNPNLRCILRDVSCEIEQGSVVGILGQSGSGKSTFVDIIGGRNKEGHIEGGVYINGVNIKDIGAYGRIVSFVGQTDLIMATQTVEENVRFAADMKMKERGTERIKEDYVKEVLTELELYHIKDYLVGDDRGVESRGISGGQRRRLSLAMETVERPKIIILDEPTSGLDSGTALLIVKWLSRLAKYGSIVMYSIHQPSQEMLRDHIDRMMVFDEGKVVYADKTANAVTWLNQRGYFKPSTTNEAESILEAIEQEKLYGRNESLIPLGLVTTGADNNDENVLAAHTKHASIQLELSSNNEPSLVVEEITDENNTERARNGSDMDRELEYLYHRQHLTGTADKTALHAANTRKKRTKIVKGDVFERLDDDEDELSYKRDEEEEESGHVNQILGLSRYPTSYIYQTAILSKRTIRNTLRNFYLLPFKFILSVIMGTSISAVFLGIGYDIPGVQGRLGTIFLILFYLGVSSMDCIPIFMREREVFSREKASGYYAPTAYYAAKVIFDVVPLRVLDAFVVSSIVYPVVGMKPGFEHYLAFVSVMCTASLISGFACILFGCMFSNISLSILFTSLFFLVNAAFSGLLNNNENMSGLSSVMRYMTFWGYAFEALVVNELYGIEVIINPNGIPLKIRADGMLWIKQLGMKVSNFLPDLFMLTQVLLVFVIAPALFLKFVVKEKR